MLRRGIHIDLLALLLFWLPASLLARDLSPIGPVNKWTNTDPPINLVHIDFGEINRHREAVGYHHRANGSDPPTARLTEMVQAPDANGIYRARVAIRDPASGVWIRKDIPSTFYPDTMSDAQVVGAILAAFHDGTRSSNGPIYRLVRSRFHDRRLVSERPDQRGLPAARPVMPDQALVTVRRHPAGFLEARARAGSGPHGEVLASFLESDVQGDLVTARALLEEVKAAQRGESPQPGGVGNAYSIVIGADAAVIRNAVLEGALPERYRLADLRAALETWISAIEDAELASCAELHPRSRCIPLPKI